MANTFAPFGLSPVRRIDGASWNDQVTTRMIAAANGHKFFRGDPVIQLASGYIDAVAIGSIAAGGTLGVFLGCEFQATASGTPWSSSYQAAQAQDTKAFICMDPMLVYRIWVGTGAASASGGPAVFADIGGNYNWQMGTGNALSGISGAYLDYASFNTTNTLPLTIIGIVQDPPGMNGTDVTTAGNLVEVTLNQHVLAVGRTGL